jgi:hypothetical protein
VADPVDPAVFLRAFLDEAYEKQFVNGFLSTDQYHRLCADLQKNPKLAAIGRTLLERSPKSIQAGKYGRLRLIHLREFGGSTFPFVQGLTQQGSRRRRSKLVCFLGHRFLQDIESSLRFNLVHLFEPHAITLRWAGDDLGAGDLFEKILTAISRADLCLFDNLATSNKPNVYIEIGIAYALRKPMLFCEYTGTGTGTPFETGSFPSDLQGLLRIQYQSYQELCKKLYFGLPGFLKHNKLL